jgi:cyclopropane fatty-acyl-phospholipid synthase-like methyltransferase
MAAFDPIFKSMASSLLEEVGLKPGHKVVDLTCRMGIPSVRAANG